MKGQINVLGLCAGYGGFELGLQIAMGARTRLAALCEWDVACQEVLLSRMAEGHIPEAPIWDDVKTFPSKAFCGKVDIVTAGYPCQPFSTHGKRLGKHDPRHLWPSIAKIVKETQAPCMFLENVEGHLSLGFREVCNDIQSMGFRFAAGMFTSAQFGATQSRKRLFILAVSDKIAKSAGIEIGDILHIGYGNLCETEEGISVHGANGSSGRMDVFPPYPDDSRWKEIIASGKRHEPAFSRMADGTSRYVDRQQMLGNGIFPLVAAHAFITLSGALRNGMVQS